MRDIKEIIVHCTATPEGREVTVHDIDQWHREAGYKGIGYHYVVYLDGSVHVGRDEPYIGAHCVGHNADSIGVCYVGGMDKAMKNAKDTRTEEQKKSLIELLQSLKSKYPEATIYGHRDFSSKDCPSFDAKTEYSRIGTSMHKCNMI